MEVNNRVSVKQIHDALSEMESTGHVHLLRASYFLPARVKTLHHIFMIHFSHFNV